jgi:hypothetical protein
MVFKLIIQRFIRQLGRTFVAWVIAPILLLAVLAFIMGWASQLECWFARAVGSPQEKPPGYRPYHWNVPEPHC